MKKLGITKGKSVSHIKDEIHDRDAYKTDANVAKNNGDSETANVLRRIARQEDNHKSMLVGLKGKSMNQNPKPAVLQQSQKEVDLGSHGSEVERTLNQPHDTGMRPHAQEALKASLETGLGDETFRSKGGDKSTDSPDSSTGHVLRY